LISKSYYHAGSRKQKEEKKEAESIQTDAAEGRKMWQKAEMKKQKGKQKVERCCRK